MLPLTDFLPQAKSTVDTNYDHSSDPWFVVRYSLCGAEDAKAFRAKRVPPYLNRVGFKPKNPYEDFGDGGAFPEIGYAQYPLCMGRSTSRAKALPVTVDEDGNLTYDTIVRQNENASRIVYCKYSDLVPMVVKNNEEEEEMDADEKQREREIESTTQETKAALEEIVGFKLAAVQPTKVVPMQSSGSKFIKYKPMQQGANFNSGAKERVVRVVEMPVDALEPPKFKHRRIPKASGDPPVPVLRSPPRPVSVKEQQDWKIPPCISNWKNQKGYTIPLHNRLAADGRVLQEVQISDNFPKLSEALYVAEQKAREAVAMRAKVERERMMREKERNEMELRKLAQKARYEKAGIAPAAAAAVPRPCGRMNHECVGEDVGRETKEEREERLNREDIREERRRERKRERMLEAKSAAVGKKTKITRDRGRDISERVALGMATAGGTGGEVLYDQRLYNQEKGMDSGFAADDIYNIYDRGLFTTSAMSALYKPKKVMDDEMYGGADEQLENLRRKTERFSSGRAFVGSTGSRDQRPEEDIFGLDKFLTDLKH